MGCFVLGAVLFTPQAVLADTVTNSVSTTAAVNIPANATPEMTQFLQNRAVLAGKMAALSSQGAPDQQALALFQQQNADLLKQQVQLAQTISQQGNTTPSPMPPALRIPPNASPQLQAYLTARDQLMRADVVFQNQHLNDDPATKQAALQQWHQQNAARIQQLQQLAQTVSSQNAPTSLPVPPGIAHASECFPANAGLFDGT